MMEGYQRMGCRGGDPARSGPSLPPTKVVEWSRTIDPPSQASSKLGTRVTLWPGIRHIQNLAVRRTPYNCTRTAPHNRTYEEPVMVRTVARPSTSGPSDYLVRSTRTSAVHERGVRRGLGISKGHAPTPISLPVQVKGGVAVRELRVPHDKRAGWNACIRAKNQAEGRRAAAEITANWHSLRSQASLSEVQMIHGALSAFIHAVRCYKLVAVLCFAHEANCGSSLPNATSSSTSFRLYRDVKRVSPCSKSSLSLCAARSLTTIGGPSRVSLKAGPSQDPVTINTLPDDVLVDIFHFYVDDWDIGTNGWHTLVHERDRWLRCWTSGQSCLW
ncbi:hypothetical protein F5148DRAFT_1369984 [Russula earlei]|uniref:Uncharacterized protein n=1 Tax=Russula earlei TaxID=71964 RepID=A0ACC0U0X5_9AGAM|nr:hypothetical protein F5148DRAFT_1369984 [Russula earlei]